MKPDGEHNMTFTFEQLKAYMEPFLDKIEVTVNAIKDSLDQDKEVWRGHHEAHYRLDREHREAVDKALEALINKVDKMFKDHTEESRRVWEKIGSRTANLEVQQALDNERFKQIEKRQKAAEDNTKHTDEMKILKISIVAASLLSVAGILVGVFT